MRFLLDTHTFLWFIDGNPKLSSRALQLIEELTSERLLSTASLWEMAIKASLSKLTVPYIRIKHETHRCYSSFCSRRT